MVAAAAGHSCIRVDIRGRPPDTIVPEPGDPQSLNRYSYVLNNPLRYTDPTGMFSEEAIYNYLLSGECGGSIECACSMYAQWQGNAEWWQMLMAAHAGDVLFGSFSFGAHPSEEFAFTFMGSGADVLTGIYSSDLAGNYMAGVLNQTRLSHIFSGAAQLVSFYAPYEFTWGGLVAFSSAQLFWRESLLSGVRYEHSYGFALDGLFGRAQRASQSKMVSMVACFGVSSPLCSIGVSVVVGALADGSPGARPGPGDTVYTAAGVTWIYRSFSTFQKHDRLDMVHLGKGSVFGNRQVDFILRVHYE